MLQELGILPIPRAALQPQPLLPVTHLHQQSSVSPFSGDDLPVSPCSALLSCAKHSQAPSQCLCAHQTVPSLGKREPGQGWTSCQAEGRNTTSRSQSSFPSNKTRLGLGKKVPLMGMHIPHHSSHGEVPRGCSLNKSHQQGLVLSSTAVD